MRTFDEQKERDEQRGDEWQFGAIAVDLAPVPVEQRMLYLPTGVLQYNNVMDTAGCASRGPNNILETKLDYFYDHGMHPNLKKWFDENGYRVNGKFALCDAFIEILSGTTRQGNSMKAPLDTLRKIGAIPAVLIPLKDNMSWDEYMNPARVTQAHIDLGKEFLRRITLNYEQVRIADFQNAVRQDLLDVALHAWTQPVDGIYPKTDEGINHVVVRLNNEIDVLDNYNSFIKRLAPDYNFFEWGYSISITNQNPYPDELITIFEVLQKYGLLAFFAEAYRRLVEVPTPTPNTPVKPESSPTEPVKTLLWDTPRNSYHSVRVLCDEEGLTLDEKNLICACIYQESGFDNSSVCVNKDKAGKPWSKDVGIVQVNDYFHCGEGKQFPSADYVVANPEKAVRWMIDMYKVGQLKMWVSYSSGAYKRWLLKSSPMWTLA